MPTSIFSNKTLNDVDDNLLKCLRKYLLGVEQYMIIDQPIGHTKHSQIRVCQRAIDAQTLQLILSFGTPFYRQGMVFYTVLKNNIPNDLDHFLRKKIKNIIVLISSNGQQIVTCFRSKNAVKFLRRKPKELKRRRR